MPFFFLEMGRKNKRKIVHKKATMQMVAFENKENYLKDNLQFFLSKTYSGFFSSHFEISVQLKP